MAAVNCSVVVPAYAVCANDPTKKNAKNIPKYLARPITRFCSMKFKIFMRTLHFGQLCKVQQKQGTLASASISPVTLLYRVIHERGRKSGDNAKKGTITWCTPSRMKNATQFQGGIFSLWIHGWRIGRWWRYISWRWDYVRGWDIGRWSASPASTCSSCGRCSHAVGTRTQYRAECAACHL